MGRRRGQRNRDNDAWNSERRDATQSGMVAALSPYCACCGQWVPTKNRKQRNGFLWCATCCPASADPESKKPGRPRLVKPAKPTDWAKPLKAQPDRLREACEGFLSSLGICSTEFAQPKTFPTTVQPGQQLFHWRENVWREVIDVVNGAALTSAPIWMRDPERAFAFMNGELKPREHFRRWRDRQPPPYVLAYLEQPT